MRALAEAFGVLVAIAALGFFAPPLLGFVVWAWSKWMRLWERLYVRGDKAE